MEHDEEKNVFRNRAFSFNKVFSQEKTNRQLFTGIMAPMVNDFMFNGRLNRQKRHSLCLW